MSSRSFLWPCSGPGMCASVRGGSHTPAVPVFRRCSVPQGVGHVHGVLPFAVSVHAHCPPLLCTPSFVVQGRQHQPFAARHVRSRQGQACAWFVPACLPSQGLLDSDKNFHAFIAESEYWLPSYVCFKVGTQPPLFLLPGEQSCCVL